MSHLINPLLVDSYIDEQPSQSVQGCFQGSDYWEAERNADKAIQARNEKWLQIRLLKQELEQCKNELPIEQQRGHRRKAERLQSRIEEIQNILSRVKL